MANPDPEEARAEAVTQLLRRFSGGDEAAGEELLAALYDELHALARRYMSEERREHTLQPTALVNEAYLRLILRREDGWEGRDHFMRTAARAMRFVLVDHARARGSYKRGGERERQPLDVELAWTGDSTPRLVAFGEALENLEAIDPQLVRVVELRFFGGHTIEETARLLDVSHGTVENAWKVARLWLAKDLEEQ